MATNKYYNKIVIIIIECCRENKNSSPFYTYRAKKKFVFFIMLFAFNLTFLCVCYYDYYFNVVPALAVLSLKKVK